jgi:hypothetical protein
MCSFITTLWLASSGRWEGCAADWHGCPSTAAEQALCLLKSLALVTHVTANDESRVSVEFLWPSCCSARCRVLSPGRRWTARLHPAHFWGFGPRSLLFFRFFERSSLFCLHPFCISSKTVSLHPSAPSEFNIFSQLMRFC